MSEQRELLIDAADRLFTHVGQRSDGEAWRELEESGLGSVLVPEEHGGAGSSFEDAGAVIQRAGWHAINQPFAETVVFRGLVGRSAGSVPDGMTTLAVECSGEFERAATGDFVYSGQLLNVPWGASADQVLFPIARGDNRGYAVMEGRSVADRIRGSNLAGEPRDTLDFRSAPVHWIPVQQDPTASVFNLGALARIAQIAGALDRVLQLSTEHVSSRRQFGKTLSEFQVIQHQMALLAEEAAAVKCASAAACRAADAGGGGFEIAAAKIRSCQAIDTVTSIAHQLHGAMGCTQEHALQLLTRRLWAWRSEFGNDRYWADLLGARVCATGAAQFWPELTAPGDRRTG